MSNVSKTILVGRVGQDPETRVFPQGGQVTKLSLATTEKWKDKQGQKQEETTWHTVKFYGRLSEIVDQYVGKGSLLYVEGQNKTESWEAQDGSKRYATIIKAREMQMLGGNQSTSTPAGGALLTDAGRSSANPAFDDLSSDIPF